MGDRYRRVTRSLRGSRHLRGPRHLSVSPVAEALRRLRESLRRLPRWVLVSLVANGVLAIWVMVNLLQGLGSLLTRPTFAKPASATAAVSTHAFTPQLGPRHQLTYQQWVNLLQQEANIAAVQPSESLTVLLGDSLSLWFPQTLLPTNRIWLNQGISGETSAGLLDRLSLLDHTQPQTILVMIGINDLLRGSDDRTLLTHYRRIVRYLKQVHPDSQVVIQAILPHAAHHATWEGRDRLLALPNSRIRAINGELAAIASDEGVYFLDLHPLFIDNEGNLQMTLSTDGLHLNSQGYLVWSTAIQLYLNRVLATRG